mgnify:CR=1 FL=1|jgi:hypothetical protein
MQTIQRTLKNYMRFSSMKTKFLIRPHDTHIYELDESNGCYRSYSCRTVTYSDGTRPNAQLHFTFENLTENYDFFAIEPEELPIYEEKHQLYLDYTMWAGRSDGHGGSKGGTMEEFLRRKR